MDSLEELNILAGRGDWSGVRSRILATPAMVKTLYTYDRSVLVSLSYWGNVETVDLLIALGADPNVVDGMGDTPLSGSLGGALSGYDTLAVTRRLLEAGADPNFMPIGGESALHKATRGRLINHMILLLDFGAYPCQKSLDMVPEDAFEVARSTRSAKVMNILIAWDRRNNREINR
jgi:ankyrin repeat protein